ncbi:MAG: MFS transporter [Pseudomonadota bacterium]
MSDQAPEFVAQRNTRRRLSLGIIPGLIAFSMGQTVLFAVAGPVFRDIGLSESQLGIIISSAAIVMVIASTIWGAITDAIGRKITIVLGLASYGLVSLLFTLVMNAGLNQSLSANAVFASLLILRLIYAALGAGIQPASVALMADTSSEADRSSAVATVGAAFGLGMVLGPASAALLVGFSILTPLYAVAALGLLGAVLATLVLPTHSRKQSSADGGSTPPLGRLWPLILCSFMLYIGMSVVQQTMAFNLQDVLLTDSVATARLTGFLFMAVALGMLTMQAGVIQIWKPRPRVLIMLGVPAIIAGHGLYVAADSLALLLGASVLMGVGFGLTSPGVSALASLLTGADAQGRVAGVLQSAMAGGFVVGPVAGTALYELDRIYAAQLALGVATLAALVLVAWLLSGRASTGDHELSAVG